MHAHISRNRKTNCGKRMSKVTTPNGRCIRGHSCRDYAIPDAWNCDVLPQPLRRSPLDQEYIMKAKIAGVLIAIAAMAPAHAERLSDVRELAAYTGLSVRQVRMVIGTRTSFAEYPYTYQRSLEKFRKALGTENYEQLMAGRPIKLDNGIEVQVASVD
jgi:hypothetical protein